MADEMTVDRAVAVRLAALRLAIESHAGVVEEPNQITARAAVFEDFVAGTETVRFREHSVQLNDVLWGLAGMVGIAGPDDGMVEADPKVVLAKVADVVAAARDVAEFAGEASQSSRLRAGALARLVEAFA